MEFGMIVERSKLLHYKIMRFLKPNPSFIRMIKNSICITVLELSCLNHKLRDGSCWVKWSCHKRSAFIIWKTFLWMVHFIGLLGRETYLHLKWKGRVIACFHFLYQSSRTMITKILGSSKQIKTCHNLHW